MARGYNSIQWTRRSEENDTQEGTAHANDVLPVCYLNGSWDMLRREHGRSKEEPPMKLSYQGIQDKAGYAAAGVKLPGYDWQQMAAKTAEAW